MSDAILFFLYTQPVFISLEAHSITLSQCSVPGKGSFSSLILGALVGFFKHCPSGKYVL